MGKTIASEIFFGKPGRTGTWFCPYSSPSYFAQHVFPLVSLFPLPLPWSTSKMKSEAESFPPPQIRVVAVVAAAFGASVAFYFC